MVETPPAAGKVLPPLPYSVSCSLSQYHSCLLFAFVIFSRPWRFLGVDSSSCSYFCLLFFFQNRGFSKPWLSAGGQLPRTGQGDVGRARLQRGKPPGVGRHLQRQVGGRRQERRRMIGSFVLHGANIHVTPRYATPCHAVPRPLKFWCSTGVVLSAEDPGQSLRII